MSTYLEAICTQEDMQAMLPSLGEYNRNTVLTILNIKLNMKLLFNIIIYSIIIKKIHIFI